MKFLFIIDPLASLKAYKDTTVAMMRAAQARGHELHVCEQTAIAARPGRIGARATRVETTGDDEDWYRAKGEAEASLASYDAVLMRKDPPFDLAFVETTWLLSAAEREGAKVFNKPSALREHNEKLGIFEFERFVAPTLVAREADPVQAFIDEHRDVILKPIDAMGGDGIFRVRADDPNRNVIVELMVQGGRRSVMAQRYLPAIKDGDKRILLIDGEPVPYCLARLAKEGETRANLAAGGRGVARPLSAKDREIGETVGRVLAVRGLLLVGLDVIGENLTEVNVTSPTCFREIQDQAGCDVSGLFIAALERRVKAAG